jgi:hypothetical protein
MRASLLSLPLVVVAAGCTAGPDQPGYYQGTAVELLVHVSQPPPGAAQIGLGLEMVPYCEPTTPDPGGPPPPRYYGPTNGVNRPVPFDSAAPAVKLAATSGASSPCSVGGWQEGQFLHFFAAHVGFGFDGRFAEDEFTATQHFLVYAPGASTFSPFGSADPALAIPEGYSLLRRTCGPRQTVALVPTSEVVEFQRLPASGPTSDIPRLRLEQRERRFLESCGVKPPVEDLGMRVGLDPAAAIVWSPDGENLRYLMRTGDSQQFNAPHSLRSMVAGGGAPTELARDLAASPLLAPGSGDLFVADLATVPQRGHLQSDGSWQFDRAPGTDVSPDGRWLALRDDNNGLSVLEIATGVIHLIGRGGLPVWSPDSHQLVFGSLSREGGVEVWSLDTGDVTARLPGTSPTWLPDGRLVVRNGIEASVISADFGSLAMFAFPAVGGGDKGRAFFPSWSELLWGRDRLVLVEPAQGWNVGTVQLKFGIGSLGDAQVGLALQEPNGSRRNLVPPDSLPVDRPYSLGASASFLQWTRTCLGLFETVCSYSLHRFTLPDGADQVVAVSSEYPVMAVSPDQKRIAVSTRRGIFVKNLP